MNINGQEIEFDHYDVIAMIGEWAGRAILCESIGDFVGVGVALDDIQTAMREPAAKTSLVILMLDSMGRTYSDNALAFNSLAMSWIGRILQRKYPYDEIHS